MKLYYHWLAAMALVALHSAAGARILGASQMDKDSKDDSSEDSPNASCRNFSPEEAVVSSMTFGGPHGDPFNDKDKIRPGQHATKLTMYHGDRVNGIALHVSYPDSVSVTLEHGGTGGMTSHFFIDHEEFITSVAVQTTKKTGRTRIGYLKFGTNKGREYEGGKLSKDTDKLELVLCPNNTQIGGFQGRSGREVDSLGFYFTPIATTLCP